MDINEFKKKLDSSVNFFKEEIKSIRTGRATPGLVEDIKIDYYNTPTLLKQLAAISTPEPRLIVISPYDKSALANIEKAVSESELGLMGANDGNVIRITIPPLTEERREEYVKLIHTKAEETRVSMRNIRREEMEALEAQEKSGDVTEDERFKGEKQIQDTLND